jgi:hypothetical protein
MSGWFFTYAPLIALCVSGLALIASLVSLGWNIYRDILLKPRLKVTFGISTALAQRENYRLVQVGAPMLRLEATNHGPGEVVCNGAVCKLKSLAFLRRLLGQHPYGFINPDFKHPHCFRLPSRIAVGDRIAIIFPYNRECFLSKNPKRIGVTDSFGRIHWTQRRELKNALKQYQETFRTPAATQSDVNSTLSQ